jgi:hypothetical protein
MVVWWVRGGVRYASGRGFASSDALDKIRYEALKEFYSGK